MTDIDRSEEPPCSDTLLLVQFGQMAVRIGLVGDAVDDAGPGERAPDRLLDAQVSVDVGYLCPRGLKLPFSG